MGKKNDIELTVAEQTKMTLNQLAVHITLVDDTLRLQAGHAVNCMLTARNWVIGCYIVEFEQHGADRAQYGEQLLKSLAKKIGKKGLSDRRLRECRQFYVAYPYLKEVIADYVVSLGTNEKWQSLTAKSQEGENEMVAIWRTATAKSSGEEVLQPWQTSPLQLFHRISASHYDKIDTANRNNKRGLLRDSKN